MSKISKYDVAPVPKLADKLIGTSVGGTPDDGTYNFTLQELLTLFLPNIPANNSSRPSLLNNFYVTRDPQSNQIEQYSNIFNCCCFMFTVLIIIPDLILS